MATATKAMKSPFINNTHNKKGGMCTCSHNIVQACNNSHIVAVHAKKKSALRVLARQTSLLQGGHQLAEDPVCVQSFLNLCQSSKGHPRD